MGLEEILRELGAKQPFDKDGDLTTEESIYLSWIPNMTDVWIGLKSI